MKKSNNISITVSAPGKIYLLGEHAVVYGKPAIIAAINQRVYVTISEENHKIVFEGSEDDAFMQTAINIFKKTYHIENLRPFRLKIVSQLAIGYHLGSSAAVAVAVMAALHVFFNKGWNPTRINELAYEVDKTRYPVSGGDNTASTFGGFIWYRKELEFLKSLWQLPFRISSQLSPFVLIDSGRSIDNTAMMVEKVKLKMKNEKLKVEKILNQQEELTKRVVIALKDGDEKLLIASIRAGEKNLEKLAVVGRKASSIIRAVEQAGGAAKILGGGGVRQGSGMLLAYHHDIKIVIDLAKKKKWELVHIQMGEEGLRKET